MALPRLYAFGGSGALEAGFQTIFSDIALTCEAGKLALGVDSDSWAYDTLNSYNTNQYSQIVLGASLGSDGPMVTINMTGTSGATMDGWVCSRSDGQWDIYEVTTGSFSLVGSRTVATTAGDIMRIERTSSTSINVKKNGVQQGAAFTISGHTGGAAGFGGSDTSVDLGDDWEGGNTSSGTTGTGAMAIVLGFTGTGQQQHSGTGSAAITLGFSGTGAAGAPFSGTGSAAIAPAFAGTAQQQHTGTGSASIPNPAFAGTGGSFTGTGAMSLGQVQYAFGDRFALTQVAMSGTGQQGFSGTGSIAIIVGLAGGQGFFGPAAMALAPVFAATGSAHGGSGSHTATPVEMSGTGSVVDPETEPEPEVGAIQVGGAASSRARGKRHTRYGRTEWDEEREKVEEVFEQHAEPEKKAPRIGMPKRWEPVQVSPFPEAPKAYTPKPELYALPDLLNMQLPDDDDEDALLLLLGSL